MVLACIVVQNVELYLLAGNKEVIGEKKKTTKQTHQKRPPHITAVFSSFSYNAVWERLLS